MFEKKLKGIVKIVLKDVSRVENCLNSNTLTETWNLM